MLKPVCFEANAEWMKPHIDAIGTVSHTPSLFEDIKKSCQQKTAKAYRAKDGFVILKPFKHSGVQKVLVWAAYSKEGNAIAKYQSDIFRLARIINAESVQYWTGIDGMVRLGERNGWRKVFTVMEHSPYERELLSG